MQNYTAYIYVQVVTRNCNAEFEHIKFTQVIQSLALEKITRQLKNNATYCKLFFKVGIMTFFKGEIYTKNAQSVVAIGNLHALKIKVLQMRSHSEWVRILASTYELWSSAWIIFCYHISEFFRAGMELDTYTTISASSPAQLKRILFS